MSIAICGTCRFFRPNGELDDRVPLGGCHRRAPQLKRAYWDRDAKVQVEEAAVWPPVKADDDCGEWRVRLG